MSWGPLEVFVNCDAAACDAHALVWAGDPEHYRGEHNELPPGWVARGHMTFCPKHR